MRTWSSCLFTILATMAKSAGVWKGFRLTAGTYVFDDVTGYATACATEFGARYRLADWTHDVIPGIPATMIGDCSARIGISSVPGTRCPGNETGNHGAAGQALTLTSSTSAWVTDDSVSYWPGVLAGYPKDSRRYVLQRQDYGLPDCWKRHGVVSGGFGAWALGSVQKTGLKLPALCYANVNATEPVAGYNVRVDAKCLSNGGFTARRGTKGVVDCAKECNGYGNCEGFDIDLGSSCRLLFPGDAYLAADQTPGISCYTKDLSFSGRAVPADCVPTPVPPPPNITLNATTNVSTPSPTPLFFARGVYFARATGSRAYFSRAAARTEAPVRFERAVSTKILPESAGGLPQDDDANTGRFFARNTARRSRRRQLYFARFFSRASFTSYNTFCPPIATLPGAVSIGNPAATANDPAFVVGDDDGPSLVPYGDQNGPTLGSRWYFYANEKEPEPVNGFTTGEWAGIISGGTFVFFLGYGWYQKKYGRGDAF
jgi:hypothetical protein